MFGWFKKKREPETGTQNHGTPTVKIDLASGMPTVKFNPAWWTETAKADLRENVKALKDVAPQDVDAIYEAAFAVLQKGFDLYLLSQALQAHGFSKERAKETSRNLASKAHAIMQIERFQKMGVKHAIWLYAGAPCAFYPKKPTRQEIRRDAAHKAANGKKFDISKGMFLNGKWTYPGRGDGCKCIARAIISGISEQRTVRT